jgi:adenylyltransferase/sulfurtransferase
LTNLQRQIVHTTDRVGESKVTSAAVTLSALNPGPELITFDRRLNDDELREQVAAADVVIDGTDNFSSRIQVNRICVETKTPLVWGAAVRLEGQVSVYHPDFPADGCYQCLYKHEDYPAEQCREMGVFTPVVGIIGTVQANEALKILAGFGDTLHGRLLLLDAARMDWMSIKLAQRADCPICAKNTDS